MSHYLSLSLSFLEVGKNAALANTKMKNVTDYQNAVAYQLLFSVELFYKHLINKKSNQRVKCTHEIGELEKDCKAIYGPDCLLSHFFDFSAPPTDPLEAVHLTTFDPDRMYQHLRFANTKQDIGGYSFNISADFFDKIKKEMMDIDAWTSALICCKRPL